MSVWYNPLTDNLVVVWFVQLDDEGHGWEMIAGDGYPQFSAIQPASIGLIYIGAFE